MKYNELSAAANKDRKRVGRGISAGQGKTAGRGTKGQGARTGSKHSHGFMGGQRAFMQAIPKTRGFKSIRVPAQVVYLDQLDSVKGTTITNVSLFEAGLIATPYHTVKIIARGEYKGKATVKVQSASASVVAAITRNGGSFESTPVALKETTNAAKTEKREKKAQKESTKASK